MVGQCVAGCGGDPKNIVQLAPGAYQVTVQARINGSMQRRTVGFDVDSCGFDPTVVVDF